VIIIRVASDQDQSAADEVWASALETLRETYRPTAHFLSEVWTPPSELTRIVALVDGQAAGVTTYYTEEDRLHLMRFGTHADFRGMGVARAMVEYLADLARAKGFGKLSVYTVKECGVVPVYENLGFKVISEEPANWAESDKYDTLTDVYLEKLLRED
jgi:GNAT superfamily N-acetyltransferase